MSISVGDFAEQLIAQDQLKGAGAPNAPTFEEDTSFYSPSVTEQAPDISQVTVPDDFVSTIVEAKEPVVSENPVVEAQTPEPQPQPLSEVAELKSLVNEVKELVLEVKNVLTEMTTVGAGIGAPAPCPDEEEEEDPVAKILKGLKKKRKASR